MAAGAHSASTARLPQQCESSLTLGCVISRGCDCGASNNLILKCRVQPESKRIRALVGIKLLHTAVWLVFAGSIVAIPFAGAWRHFRLVAGMTGLVLVECAVLAWNQGRCPLTDVAGRYTEERTDNFDIYLPLWLARHNKSFFGTFFVIGELFVLGRWLISR